MPSMVCLKWLFANENMQVQFVYALYGLFEWLCANENMQVQFVYALYGLFEVVVCKLEHAFHRGAYKV